MSKDILDYDVLLLGAGMAGLAAARTLSKESARSVCLLEKARGPGGKLTTKRFLNHRIDHGAQMLRARTEEFGRLLTDAWQAGVLTRLTGNGQEACYVGSNGISAFPRYLAQDLTLYLQTRVERIEQEDDSYLVHSTDGKLFRARQLLSSCPLPQLQDILKASSVSLQALASELPNPAYSTCLSVIYLLEEGSLADIQTLPYEPADGIDLIADCSKRSPQNKKHALCVQLDAPLSERLFEDADDHILDEVASRLAFLTTANIIGCTVHRWRYARPTIFSDGHYQKLAPDFYVIGEAYSGATAEEAYLSGQAAAKDLLHG